MKRILVAWFCVFLCAAASAQVEVRKSDKGYDLYVDGQKTYVKGVGGTFKLDVAAASGANACRTWSGNVRSVERTVAEAKANGMYVMQGIALTKDPKMYEDEAYKERLRKECRELAERFKDDESIILWGIGNEIELNGNSTPQAWEFVNELSLLIKSIDKRHLTSAVITSNAKSIELVAKYAPSLDVLGINCYGSISSIGQVVARSSYKGPYMITEWGPTGWWECKKTEWGAPIEQTSEEKRLCYEQRYNDYIYGDPVCLGSFVFLWGQKEERTPTWFSMFTEQNVEGFPFSGLKSATVEAMERVWTRREPKQTAPVIFTMTAEGRTVHDNPTFEAGSPVKIEAAVIDREGDPLTYVWEVLREATVTATGGAYEPRPDRVGEICTTDRPELDLTISEPGNYRVYIYALDGTGYASSTNLPIRIR